MYDFASDKRLKVEMKKIVVPKDRGRKDFSHVMELKKSIESVGLLHPIVLNQNLNEDTFTLIAGESRYRACLMIPALSGFIPYTLFENLPPLIQKEMELEENLRRKDLAWTETIDNLEQYDTLKRQIHGDKARENPDGWTLKQTAELTNMNMGQASAQISFARKLKERPDLKLRVKSLPLAPAMKVFDQILEAEKTERLHKTGQLNLVPELLNLDAVAYLKSQPDNSIDLFLTDPPFGMQTLEDRRESTASDGAVDSGSLQSYIQQIKPSDNQTGVEVLTLLAKVLPEIYRTLKPGCHFYMFFELEYLGKLKELAEDSGLEITWPVLIWDKGRTTSPFRGYSYSCCYESILFGFKPCVNGPKRLSEACKAILPYSPLHATKKVHVFEKPLDLLTYMIKLSTNYNDVVCDPFVGSGATLAAALQSGRRGIGCELDKENWLKAQGRLLIEQHTIGGAK